MTAYTNPHSLPKPEATDKIAADVDNLRAHMGALADATNTALDAVEGRRAVALGVEAARADEAAQGIVDDELLRQGFVKKIDPAIPRQTSINVYVEGRLFEEVTSTEDDKFLGGRSGGTQVFPRLEVGSALHDSAQPLAGASVTIQMEDRHTESTLDHEGNVPDWVLARWAERGGFTGTGGVLPWVIVVSAGQSNATKRSLANLLVPHPRVYRWVGGAAVQETGVPWVGSGFAYEYANAHPDVRVLIVECAIGSTGFTSTSITPAPGGYHTTAGTWDRTLVADPVNLYADMITELTAARTATSGTIIAMLWSQGEEDRFTDASYQAHLDDLITQARTDLSTPNLPVIQGLMTPESIEANQGAYSTAIIQAQESALARIEHTAVIKGLGGESEQTTGIHWTPSAQHERGGRMAVEGMNMALNNKVGYALSPPRHLTATRSGGKVYLEWRAPLCRVGEYTIETSTDSGSTWTPQTLPFPQATVLSLTVAAGTPLWARAKNTVATDESRYTMEVKA